MIIQEIPFLFRFQIEGQPNAAEAGWSFPSLLEARTMAHFTLRQALLGQEEPCGYAEIFDGISGDPLGAVAAILHDNTEHWTWREAEKASQRAH